MPVASPRTAAEPPHERLLPRYVSYPTAGRFRPDVGEPELDAWVAALPAGATLALRVHVPFCARLCWFCCCRTQRVRARDTLADYVEALGAEIDRLARRLPPGATATSIAWVGGSPTVLPPELMDTLDARLRAALPVAPGARFSVEIEPHGLDASRLAALRACGLTEAAVGLQDFDPAVQAAVGREQRLGRVAATFAALRAAGVATVAVELLYGLPRQTVASVAATVAALAGLGPDRVTLAPYAHAPWMAKRQRMIPEESLPDPASRALQFAAAAAGLEAAGYRACGVDLFARPGDPLAEAAADGRLRRDVEGYAATAPTAAIGLGAASISRLPQGYVQNAAETGAYLGRVAAGRAAACRGAAFSLEDRVRGRAIEALMCARRIDLAALRREFGDFVQILDGPLALAAARFAGAVRVDADGLALLGAAPETARRVAQVFDAYAAV